MIIVVSPRVDNNDDAVLDHAFMQIIQICTSRPQYSHWLYSIGFNCRFTVSAGHGSAFKTVTLKRLWFGEFQNLDRRVQVRLTGVKSPPVAIR